MAELLKPRTPEAAQQTYSMLFNVLQQKIPKAFVGFNDNGQYQTGFAFEQTGAGLMTFAFMYEGQLVAQTHHMRVENQHELPQNPTLAYCTALISRKPPGKLYTDESNPALEEVVTSLTDTSLAGVVFNFYVEGKRNKRQQNPSPLLQISLARTRLEAATFELWTNGTLLARDGFNLLQLPRRTTATTAAR